MGPSELALRPVRRALRPTRQAPPSRAENRAFLAAWLLFVVLSAVDCVSTVYALGHHLRETNPLAALLWRDGGAVALWGFKFAVLAVMLPLLVRLPRRIGLAVAILLALALWLNDASNLVWIVRAG